MTVEKAFLIIVCLAYAGATLSYALALIYDRARWEQWALRVLGVGFGLHTIALGIGATTGGHPPFRSFLESLGLYAWAVVAIYLVLQWRKRQQVWGVLLIPFALAGVAASVFAPTPSLPPMLEGESLRLSTHGATAFLAYGLFTLAFGSAVLHLAQQALLKGKRFGALYHRLPSLSATDELCRVLVGLGLLFLTAALITGSLWAEKAWGSPWPWDAKLALALLTWIIFVGYFFARNVAHWRGRRPSWIVVTGFVFILATYLSGQVVGTIHSF